MDSELLRSELGTVRLRKSRQDVLQQEEDEEAQEEDEKEGDNHGDSAEAEEEDEDEYGGAAHNLHQGWGLVSDGKEREMEAVVYTQTKAEQQRDEQEQRKRAGDRYARRLFAFEMEPSSIDHRERFELCGVMYLDLKAQTAEWLRRFGVAVPDEMEHGVVPTEYFFKTLKQGDLLCTIVNRMSGNRAIKSYVTEFDAQVMASLDEQTNIRKFLRACKEFLQVPESLLFEVNDLHVRQNMPKVVLSLRAIAKYAEELGLLTPEFTWPHDDRDEDPVYEEDAVLYAAAEMSKLDWDTVQHLYVAASGEDKNVSTQVLLSENPEAEPFQTKQHMIKQVVRKMSERNNTMEEIPNDGDDEEQDYRDVRPQVNNVQLWLEELGLGYYWDLFLEDGWEDMDTVCTMTDRDFENLGITKRGHVRKLCMAVNRANRVLGNQEPPQPLGEKAEEQTDEMKWRIAACMPVNVEETSALWTLMRELEYKIHHSKYDTVDTMEALLEMSKVVEDEAKSLGPFAAPIVLDIGWHTIKCGFVYSSKVRKVPMLVGRMDNTQGVSLCGEQVFEMIDRVSKIRQPIHHGLNEITEPSVMHWEDLKVLMTFVFQNVLNISKEIDHPVFLIKQERHPGERRRWYDFLRNELNVPCVVVETNPAILVANECGLESCVVLDIGESRCTATAIENMEILHVEHSPIAGRQLTIHLMKQLQKEGASFETVFEPLYKDGYMRRLALEQFYKAQAIKEEICNIAPSEDQAMNSTLRHYSQDTEIPSPISAYLPEALFNPMLIRNDQFYNGGSIQDIIRQGLDKLAANKRKNVIITGGGANIPGLQRRLHRYFADVNIIIPGNPDTFQFRAAQNVVSHPRFYHNWNNVTKPTLFPLVSPESQLFKTNKAIAAMHYLATLLTMTPSSPIPTAESSSALLWITQLEQHLESANCPHDAILNFKIKLLELVQSLPSDQQPSNLAELCDLLPDPYATQLRQYLNAEESENIMAI